MVRPRRPRFCCFRPNVFFFKPQGVPLRHLELVFLEKDELEALKLHDVDGLDQIQAAEKMKISQPTFARILDSVYKKVADAIINGKAIEIKI